MMILRTSVWYKAFRWQSRGGTQPPFSGALGWEVDVFFLLLISLTSHIFLFALLLCFHFCMYCFLVLYCILLVYYILYCALYSVLHCIVSYNYYYYYYYCCSCCCCYNYKLIRTRTHVHSTKTNMGCGPSNSKFNKRYKTRVGKITNEVEWLGHKSRNRGWKHKRGVQVIPNRYAVGYKWTEVRVSSSKSTVENKVMVGMVGSWGMNMA